MVSELRRPSSAHLKKKNFATVDSTSYGKQMKMQNFFVAEQVFWADLPGGGGGCKFPCKVFIPSLFRTSGCLVCWFSPTVDEVGSFVENGHFGHGRLTGGGGAFGRPSLYYTTCFVVFYLSVPLFCLVFGHGGRSQISPTGHGGQGGRSPVRLVLAGDQDYLGGLKEDP